MAKKISKHSRAARRLEIDDADQKSISKISRSEKTDVTSAIIRATVKKNETLLHNKQINKAERSRVSKAKKQDNTTNLNKEKVERAILLSDKLEGKILKSKERARMVQATRKSNWDSINSKARETLNAADKDGDAPSTNEHEGEGEGEAIEEDNFYTDDEEEKDTSFVAPKANAFALLGDDVDA